MSEARHCKRCESVFFLRPDQIIWFESKGYPVPSHCPTCRRERRLSRELEARAYEARVSERT